MFSENNKISERQVFRLLTFDLLGLSTLLIPTVLAELAGRDGIFCIAVGVAAGLLFLGLLKMALADMQQESFGDYLTRKVGSFGAKLLQAGYLIYLLLLAGYTAYLFSALVRKNLLREVSFSMVLLPILLLAGYGLLSGIEGRARIYELLFWFLMIPLLLMLISAVDEIDVDYWTPVFYESAVDVLSGSYYVFICISLVFLVLFLSVYVEKREGLFGAAKGALLFVGGVHVVLYLVLLGIFGKNALAAMDYPAVTLMSTVKISGGFLKRADAFMFGIWFFTLYALLNSAVFYGGIMLHGVCGKKKYSMEYGAVLLVVWALALVFYQVGEAGEYYELFLWYVGTPFLVLAPLLLAVTGKKKQKTKTLKENYRINKKIKIKKWKNAGLTAVTLFFAALLSGCVTPELEDRNFPIELAVTDTTHFNEEWMNAAQAGNRVIDYSHLKVILLEQQFVENETSMKEFLELLETQDEVPRNTYVVVTENAQELMEQTDGEGESIGTYIEELFENVSQIEKTSYPTLGMLYQEQKNKMETLFIPYLTREGEKPVVDGYYVWKRGNATGRIDSEAAQLSFFTSNAMKKYTVSLGQGTEIELFDSHNEIEFSGTAEQKTVQVYIHCKARTAALPAETSYDTQTLAGMLENNMNQIAEEALQNEQAIDVANSYKKLGGCRRDWYPLYAASAKDYEAAMHIVYHLKITWVDI